MTLVPVLERLEAADPSTLGRSGLGLVLADVRVLRRFVESIEVQVAQRASELAAAGTSPPPEEVIAQGERSSGRHGKAVESAAAVAAAHADLGAALHDGALGLDHLGEYHRATKDLDDTQREAMRRHHPGLLDDASTQTAEQFGRAVRAHVRSLRSDDGETRAAQQRSDRSAKFGLRTEDGMVTLFGQWDPVTGERIRTRVRERALQLLAADPSLTEQQAMADALAELVLSPARASSPGLSEVVVFIDLDSLLTGAHEGGVAYLSNGEQLPVSTVRRLCCEAKILPMVLGGDGEPLDVGRERRTATRAQRRALRKLYKSCAHPHCHVRFDECEIHHVDFWEHGGHTDLGRMLPLCSRHHHLVHDLGWRLTLDADRTINLFRPDGTHHLTAVWRPPDGEHPRTAAGPSSAGAHAAERDPVVRTSGLEDWSDIEDSAVRRQAEAERSADHTGASVTRLRTNAADEDRASNRPAGARRRRGGAPPPDSSSDGVGAADRAGSTDDGVTHPPDSAEAPRITGTDR
ncbi:MAG: hypothetical protein R2705_15225 [Ilumatobacteraceae bacterium]